MRFEIESEPLYVIHECNRILMLNAEAAVQQYESDKTYGARLAADPRGAIASEAAEARASTGEAPDVEMKAEEPASPAPGGTGDVEMGGVSDNGSEKGDADEEEADELPEPYPITV